MPEFRNSDKQMRIMDFLIREHDAGRDASLDALRDDLDYGRKVSAQAIRQSLKYLESHGLVTSKRPGLYRFYAPTAKAYELFRR
jgi:DNA-binding transcriptional ArsR family regulator